MWEEATRLPAFVRTAGRDLPVHRVSSKCHFLFYLDFKLKDLMC